MKNLCILIGRLGQNPKTTTFANGNKAAEFTIATSFNYKDKETGERKEITDWHRVKCYGALAGIVGQYLIKGSLIYAEGMYKTETYTDKEGVSRRSSFLRMEQMKMLDGKKKDESYNPHTPASSPSMATTTADASNSAEEDGDDLPF